MLFIIHVSIYVTQQDLNSLRGKYCISRKGSHPPNGKLVKTSRHVVTLKELTGQEFKIDISTEKLRIVLVTDISIMAYNRLAWGGNCYWKFQWIINHCCFLILLIINLLIFQIIRLFQSTEQNSVLLIEIIKVLYFALKVSWDVITAMHNLSEQIEKRSKCESVRKLRSH